jgi:DNA-binding Lrp family transcriptional regulator
MKLNAKEALVLAAVEFRADAPIKMIQKETGLREHVIRHALRRMLERKVVTPVPFINLHRLGLSVYSVYFSCAGESRTTKRALIKTLISSPETLWVGEFGGEYQYAVAFCAESLPPLLHFLRQLSNRYPDVFYEKAISIQVSSTIFPRKYLTSRKLTAAPQTVTFSNSTVKIDDIDRRILSGLTTHSQLSHRQIALKLQMPLSSFELRVRKLHEQKVIVSTVYFADAASFGRQSFKLLVYTKGLDFELTKRMYAFCEQHLDVVYMIECFGSWNFEIGIEVLSAEQVGIVMHELYEEFGATINTIKLLTKFSYPKVSWFPEMGRSLRG